MKMNHPLYVQQAVAQLEKILKQDDSRALERLMRLSRGEIYALKILAGAGDSLTATCLAHELRTTKARVTALMRSLEKKGYVWRVPDEKNRRQVNLSLSPAGRRYLIGVLEESYAVFAAGFEALGEDESRQFLELTERFFTAMKEKEAQTR